MRKPPKAWRHASFVEVHRRVLGGETARSATKAEGVSTSGYARWRLRNDLKTIPSLIPCSIFKAVELEVRAIQSTREICARFGVDPRHYWKRKTVAPFRLDAILRVHRLVRAQPTTAQICAKYNVTPDQLHRWRSATGGLPK